MESNVECWIGRKYLGNLREIMIFNIATHIGKGYLMTEKEAKETAQKRGWKVQKTAKYDYK